MNLAANKILASVKTSLKKIPYVLTTKRRIYRGSYLVSKYIFGLVRGRIFEPLMRFTVVRELMFDTIPSTRLLIAQSQNETFIVSSQDQAIGRMLTCHGLLDYEVLGTVVSLLGTQHSLDMIVDVGANIGTVSVTAVKRGVFKRAIAIEPGPLNFTLLTANILLNGISDQIITHNIALGSTDDDHLTFELSDSNFGDHRIRVRNDAGLYEEDQRKTLMIKSKTLDSVVSNINSANALIWMDTQGYEGHVLTGAPITLAKQIPLVIEFWPYGMNRTKSYQPLKKALIAAGYKSFYDLSNPNLKMQLTEKALDEIYDRLGEAGNFTDLFIL